MVLISDFPNVISPTVESEGRLEGKGTKGTSGSRARAARDWNAHKVEMCFLMTWGSSHDFIFSINMFFFPATLPSSTIDLTKQLLKILQTMRRISTLHLSMPGRMIVMSRMAIKMMMMMMIAKIAIIWSIIITMKGTSWPLGTWGRDHDAWGLMCPHPSHGRLLLSPSTLSLLSSPLS